MQIISGQLCINDVLVAYESLELYGPTGSSHTNDGLKQRTVGCSRRNIVAVLLTIWSELEKVQI